MLRAFNYVVGIALLAATGYFLYLEYQTPPVPTGHLLFHGVFVVIALVLMHFAQAIAEGIAQIGRAAAPLLPWIRKPPTDDGAP